MSTQEPAHRRTPAAPRDLKARGRSFWRATLKVYDLSEVEVQILREACRLMDEVDDLRSALDDGGATVTGSMGQTRVNPAYNELRQHRLALAKLLAQLALPDVDEPAQTPTQSRAAAAANARWKTAKERAARGTA